MPPQKPHCRLHSDGTVSTHWTGGVSGQEIYLPKGHPSGLGGQSIYINQLGRFAPPRSGRVRFPSL